MVAYSFKRQFIEPSRSGSKTQTIRADRVRHARIGETLQLYTAMRTKHCMLIATSTCIGIDPITLDFKKNEVLIPNRRPIKTVATLNHFAYQDGFAAEEPWEALREFWRKEHDAIQRWSGVLIAWGPITMPDEKP